MTSDDADIDDHVPTDDHDQSARADAPDPDPEPEPGRTVLTRRGMLFATSVAGLLGLGPSAAAASTNTGSGQIGTDATPLAKVITNQLNGADIQNATSGDVLESDGSGGLTFAAAGGGGTSPWEVDNNNEFDDQVVYFLQYLRENPREAVEGAEDVAATHAPEAVGDWNGIPAGEFDPWRVSFRNENGVVSHPDCHHRSDVMADVRQLLAEFDVVPPSPFVSVTVR
jgi:hypothetical protein